MAHENTNVNGPAKNFPWLQMAQFNTSDPESWMDCAESFLSMSKVTDPTEKCLYIISKMDSHALRETVKTQRLLEGEEIGDRTPSQFLRHLKSLAGSAMPEDVLRVIWTKGLPTDMQAAVVAKRDTPLDALADIADLVAENVRLRCTRPSPPVAAISTHDTDERLRRLEENMSLLIKNLQQAQVSEVDARSSRPRGRANSRSRTPSRSRTRPADWLCWYHHRYGAQARKCIEPCPYNKPQQGNASGSH
ncbi:uncharacterized protein LOC135075409 [Ostrinia nubilalis]|uniref:uncharacterized protein LOC135075409 n=1 Tax=Ostrinia nubilalis TaxID=29057 RepID=UPI003082395F